MDAARKTAPVPPPPRPAAGGSGGSIKQQLHDWLSEQGMSFIVDAVGHADVVESGSEIIFTAPREFAMSLKSGDMQKAIQAVLGKPLRIRVETGQGSSAPAARTASPAEDEATSRALDNPEVKRFRELFPGSTVRTVRNLKE
jgi:hypothetical protein